MMDMISISSLICAPITEVGPDSFLATIHEAERIADAIELRFDYLPAESLPQLIVDLSSSIARVSKPLIFTFRPREQGGKRDLSLQDRRDFWRGLPPEIVNSIAYADFEFDLVESFANELPPAPWEKVICSWHECAETPHDLIARYDQMASTPAAVVKIATQANRITDCLRVFELIEHAKGKKPVIALAMGLPGLMTRVLAPARGAILTFGSLRRGAESAAGQPTVAELRDLYRVKQLSRASEVFGVIGNPVGHSRSPPIHNAALKALNRDGVYLPFEVDDLESFVCGFVHPKTGKLDWNLRGLSVTIPHKLAIIPYLDFVDATAGGVGAVNTVVVEGDELHGYNTDVAGAMKPLADEFRARTASLESFNGEADVVINCAPVGMSGPSVGRSLIKAESLEGVKLVYDLIYTPEETALLADAKRAGCRTLGGLAMLVGQAAEQFRLWTGLEAPVDVMSRAVKGNWM